MSACAFLKESRTCAECARDEARVVEYDLDVFVVGGGLDLVEVVGAGGEGDWHGDELLRLVPRAQLGHCRLEVLVRQSRHHHVQTLRGQLVADRAPDPGRAA